MTISSGRRPTSEHAHFLKPSFVKKDPVDKAQESTNGINNEAKKALIWVSSDVIAISI